MYLGRFNLSKFKSSKKYYLLKLVIKHFVITEVSCGSKTRAGSWDGQQKCREKLVKSQRSPEFS